MYLFHSDFSSCLEFAEIWHADSFCVKECIEYVCHRVQSLVSILGAINFTLTSVFVKPKPRCHFLISAFWIFIFGCSFLGVFPGNTPMKEQPTAGWLACPITIQWVLYKQVNIKSTFAWWSLAACSRNVAVATMTALVRQTDKCKKWILFSVIDN